MKKGQLCVVYLGSEVSILWQNHCMARAFKWRRDWKKREEKRREDKRIE
jgi:hypothetical protein